MADEDGGSFDYNEEDLKIPEEQEIQDEGIMPALEAIANLLKMEDFSGTLGELHTYFTDALEKEEDKMRAADIAKTLQELSAYILSWEYAEETYEKPFLMMCKKVLDNKIPKSKIESFEKEQVFSFFERALALEPELAETIQKKMREKDDGEMEDYEE